MEQETLTQERLVKTDVTGRFELEGPGDESKSFSNLLELLLALNHRDGICNEYHGNTAKYEVWTSYGRSYDLVQRCSEIGFMLTSEDGPVGEIIDALFALTPFVMDSNGKAKKPWQMSRAQWEQVNLIGKIAHNVIPCLGADLLRQHCTSSRGESVDVAEYMNGEFLRRFGYGHNGPLYGSNESNSRHEIHVAYALAEGLPVPESVQVFYRESPRTYGGNDLSWFPRVLEDEYLRGRMPTAKLKILLSLAKGSGGFEISNENIGHFVTLLSELPRDAGYMQIDDFLYTKGILRVEPLPESKVEQGDGPVNAFASEVSQMIAQASFDHGQERAMQDRAKGYATLRDVARTEMQGKQALENRSYGWGNELARAIEEHDVSQLMQMLGGTGNETSKRAIKKHFGINLLKANTEQRQRSIFALAGYISEEDYAAAVVVYQRNVQAKAKAAKDLQEAKKKETELDDARAFAARTKFNYSGSILNGAEFVDKLVQEGFSQLGERRRGAASRAILTNPTTDRMVELKAIDGTAAYAKLILN